MRQNKYLQSHEDCNKELTNGEVGCHFERIPINKYRKNEEIQNLSQDSMVVVESKVCQQTIRRKRDGRNSMILIYLPRAMC